MIRAKERVKSLETMNEVKLEESFVLELNHIRWLVNVKLELQYQSERTYNGIV